ncbi:MAG: xanthine dehydrogenase family protein molybdopterin-binding subunit [Chloroflexota bacterium]|nr:xanthine dehydrogenase family protein molybdopterin-binding subunit [Chloroflexota bacterium]
MPEHADQGFTGQPIRRREDAALLTGRGRFVDDLTPPGLVHLAFHRSPHAHARICSIDVDAARGLPGVITVLTAQDVADLPDLPLNQRARDMLVPPNPLLARDTVNAVGVPVAAIAAHAPAIAADAAALVEVGYEPLAGIADAAAALAPEAPLAWPELSCNLVFTTERSGGNVQRAFAQARRKVALTVHSPRLTGVPIEPRAVLVAPDPLGDGLTMWVSAQSAFRLRTPLARLLGLAENRLRVITPDVGGAFGVKNSLYREYAMAALLALRLGRPVKWVATRAEEFVAMQQGRDMRIDVELALDEDGAVGGMRVRNVANLGAYLQPAAVGPPARPLTQAPGCYRVPHASVEVAGVVTNTTGTGPYRGAGRPESVLLIERAIDAAARALDLDPVTIRRRNFVPPADFPHTNVLGAVYDSGDYQRALERALELADWPALLRDRATARQRGEVMGVGLATFIEPSAGAGFESGIVRVDASGKVTAITGSSTQGQGHETAFAQVVADRLGVPMAEVVVLHGDTHAVPQAVGTFGSRSATLGGSALALASERVLHKARRIAAHLLEVSVDDLQLADDHFAVAGAPDRRVSWADLARAAYATLDLPEGDEPGLEATAFFAPQSEAYGFGAHIAVVSIDRETGRVTVRKLVCVDDCGRVLNPLLVEGQVIGGIAQALGQALMEQMVFDAGGQVLSASLADYAIPRAVDMPALHELVLAHTVTPSPWNPLGAKGVGESGTVGAPAALANAVVDALAPFGVRHVDMPFTAEKVWRLLTAPSTR